MELQELLLSAMNDSVSKTYLQQGSQSKISRNKLVSILLKEKKWPKEGWDDLTIEMLLNELALMDSNNFPSRCGVGEREGRIYSSMVSRRHFRLSHGVGRSGDLGEVQPKAAGSSILSVLTNSLLLDLCRTHVSRSVSDVFLCPTATGLSISLVLLTLAKEKPGAKYVIWPRIDQKSCFKCILTAGLQPLIIEPKLIGEELQTNTDEIERIIADYGTDKILCILATTSCFAPRACDTLEVIGRLCKSHNLFHVVNNAYGLQSGKCAYSISQAAHHGRVDIFVQSTDKNLMVPVGGAIIAGFNKTLVQKIRQNYPGRASSSQFLDVFITLLSMGSNEYTRLLKKRSENYKYLKNRFGALAEKFSEHIIQTPNNQISIGMTLSNIGSNLPESERPAVISKLGSMLFLRSVCGARVVPCDQTVKSIDGYDFQGWGSHCKEYPYPYITAAASIGMETKDVDLFVEKLEECLKKLSKQTEEPENPS
ncbi:unnamed protein product [Allacma fusca]|uniref:O-phosphoseryl-tRNA(Sec) selenium transferase n=1 Tax=Allacma fusca TaxID=39272 RepID=A0A8J2L909_9HEXA|nr:unnamed protein product [Allacma fusca]